MKSSNLMTDNNHFAEMDSDVAGIANHIIECSYAPISINAEDIAKITQGTDLVKGLSLECMGEDLGKVGASSIEAIANISGFQLNKLLLFIEARRDYKLMMNQIQECVSTLPTTTDVIWGFGINANPSDYSREIGLFYIAGYKKTKGVSRNAPRND